MCHHKVHQTACDVDVALMAGASSPLGTEQVVL